MERQKIQTSIDAYKSLEASSVRAIYEKILNALKILGSASTEKIAEYLCVEHAKVHKRVSEMERLEMIWRPGGKTCTKSGRSAYLWTIRGDKQPKTETEIKYISCEKTSSEYANNILKQSELFQ